MSLAHEGKLPLPKSSLDPKDGMVVISVTLISTLFVILALPMCACTTAHLHATTYHLHLLGVVFIVDTGKAVYVWTGKGASPDEKKNALPYAHVSSLLMLIPFCPHTLIPTAFPSFFSITSPSLSVLSLSLPLPHPSSPSLTLPLPPSSSLSFPHSSSLSLTLPLPSSPFLSFPLPPSPSFSLPHSPSPFLSLTLPLPHSLLSQNYLIKTKHPLVPVSCYPEGREAEEFWKAVA